jgi:hypothetical protein
MMIYGDSSAASIVASKLEMQVNADACATVIRPDEEFVSVWAAEQKIDSSFALLCKVRVCCFLLTAHDRMKT